MTLEQMSLEPVHEFDARRCTLHPELQFERDGMQDFVRGHVRMSEIDGFDVRRKARLQHVAQHGLAAADLARYLDNPFALHDGVHQRFEYRAPIAAAKEEIGVRRYAERGLIESEMGVIHGLRRPPAGPLFRGCGRETLRFALIRVVLHAAVERGAVYSQELRGLR